MRVMYAFSTYNNHFCTKSTLSYKSANISNDGMHPTSPDTIVYCINLSKQMIWIPIELIAVMIQHFRTFIAFKIHPFLLMLTSILLFNRTNGVNLLNISWLNILFQLCRLYSNIFWNWICLLRFSKTILEVWRFTLNYQISDQIINWRPTYNYSSFDYLFNDMYIWNFFV